MSFSVYGSDFSVSPSVASLPAYTARARPSTATRELTEHVFELKDKKKKAWATLKLSSSARSSNSLPTFLEGDKIRGSVTLDLENGEKILGVSILIRGQIVTGPQKKDTVCFLDTSTPLWLKSMTDSRDPRPATHMPFSICLPKEVIIANHLGKHGVPRSYHLPQPFLERTTQASVYYELFVHIARSTFRVDSKLQTMFVYVPAIRPDPPSPLRQLAYRENALIPGPEADPAGWHTLPSITIKGKVFNSRDVKIRCAFSLAKPLSYTRGSAIPCSLTFSCEDIQALNLVCSPTTIRVCLYRQVTHDRAPHLAEHNVLDTVYYGEPVLEISRAVWWPFPPGPSPDRCRFDGEIHLQKNLKPTTAIAHFSICYSVVMLPFQVTGFAPQDVKPMLTQEVQIATIFAKGPKPRVHTPPGYENEINDNMFTAPSGAYV